MLSEALGDGINVTLIDKSDAFVFGFSKLDMMFGRKASAAVRLPYRDVAKPGVRFRRETIGAIDLAARRVTTDSGTYEADILVEALGDVANVGVPKAGVFAEGQARIMVASLIARLTGAESSAAYDGRGSCYVEFGGGRVGRIDVDFFSGPKPTGTLQGPSAALVADKELFGSSRRARWFGR
jgi:NADH dehydrogenase FAD-containing subunit